MATETQTDPATTEPQIHTYHCLCTNLLFASTTAQTSLPIRTNALDKAIILPLPLSPTDTAAQNPSSEHYALLLSTTPSTKPQIITKSDGFEKRYLQRCSRCRIPVGYQLDWTHWGVDAGERYGRREDVVFLLPGGCMSTQDMVNGKDMGKEVVLGAKG